jgi:hypothetical protein
MLPAPKRVDDEARVSVVPCGDANEMDRRIGEHFGRVGACVFEAEFSLGVESGQPVRRGDATKHRTGSSLKRRKQHAACERPGSDETDADVAGDRSGGTTADRNGTWAAAGRGTRVGVSR